MYQKSVVGLALKNKKVIWNNHFNEIFTKNNSVQST